MAPKKKRPRDGSATVENGRKEWSAVLTMASAVSAVEGEECGETVTGISGGSAKSCGAAPR